MKLKFLILVLLLSLSIFDIAYAQEPGRVEVIPTNETLPPERCEPNLGEVCSNNDDCKGCHNYEAFCLKCPVDTQVVIQTDPDPYYAELTNDTHFVTKSPDKGYCAYRAVGTRKCIGNWNGDEYLIVPAYETADSSIYQELTKDVLDKWKNLILINISENYFKEHIDISIIEPQVENNILGVGIQYRFKYDWAVTNNTEREIIYVKQLSNGKWVWLSDEEIERRFDEFRQFLHNMVFSDGSVGYTKPTEYEISSIISRQDAISKLKQCHKDIELETITIGSKNNTIQLTASGKVYLNTERCMISPKNTFTVVSGSVDLVTGESTCASHESPCVVYAPGKKRGIISGVSNIITYVGIGVIVVIIILLILLRRRK